MNGKTGYLAESLHARKKVMMPAGFTRSAGACDYPGLGWAMLVRADAIRMRELTAQRELGRARAEQDRVAALRGVADMIERELAAAVDLIAEREGSHEDECREDRDVARRRSGRHDHHDALHRHPRTPHLGRTDRPAQCTALSAGDRGRYRRRGTP